MARILIAEDDSGMRRFIATNLERAGHRVVQVADGRAALSALRTGRYDVLLADADMPGMDGVELARQARSAAPGIRVIFITGFAAVQYLMGGSQTPQMPSRLPGAPGKPGGARVATPGGTMGALSKPFHLRDLPKHIESLDREMSA